MMIVRFSDQEHRGTINRVNKEDELIGKTMSLDVDV